jgi:hypothetical protein
VVHVTNLVCFSHVLYARRSCGVCVCVFVYQRVCKADGRILLLEHGRYDTIHHLVLMFWYPLRSTLTRLAWFVCVCCVYAQRVCKEDGRILLLEHGRSHYDWLNNILDGNCQKHTEKWGSVVARGSTDIHRAKRHAPSHSFYSILFFYRSCQKHTEKWGSSLLGEEQIHIGLRGMPQRQLAMMMCGAPVYLVSALCSMIAGMASNILLRHGSHRCIWNRDVEGLLKEAGLEVRSLTRYHFGTTYYIEASPPAKPPVDGEGSREARGVVAV